MEERKTRVNVIIGRGIEEMAGILAAIQAGIPAVLALVKTADKIVVERTGFFVSRFSRLCKNTV